MAPQDSLSVGPKAPSKSLWLRYGVSLVLLVAVVGGIAWLTQYMRSKPAQVVPPPPPAKEPLYFPRSVARWGESKKSTGKDDGESKELMPKREIEHGTSGHYDFLFKNRFGSDVAITSFTTACDCTSVKACVLSDDEWQRANSFQEATPSQAIPYSKEPVWLPLHAENRADAPGNPKKESLVIKPNEGGVVRVEWTATKFPGQDLKVFPAIWVQTLNDSRRASIVLNVPLRIQVPLLVDGARIPDVYLKPGATQTVEFDAWSPTREKLEFDFIPVPNDSLLEVKIKQGTPQDCARLQPYVIEKQLGNRVLSCYRVSVTVYESKGGKQLERGSFYRKLMTSIEGRPPDPDQPLPVVELMGRVKEEDVLIGGPDDAGRIRFKSFDAKLGGSKTVYLSASADLALEHYQHHPNQPEWIKVTLKRETKAPTEGRHTWQLRVEVPPGTRGARSFNHPDAVVLRIPGPPERLVRIPLEGNIGGGKQ